jgi:DNA-binding transcriptional MerR regulator
VIFAALPTASIAVSSRRQVPDKLYFKIGEVASLLGVKPYVLRYWESEFSAIRPSKTRSKHRMYRQRDIAVLRQIQRLLYDERLTIEGAKKRLKTGVRRSTAKPKASKRDASLRSTLNRVKKEIESLRRILS